MSGAPRRSSERADAFRHRAEALGASLPPLLIAAERVAATVAHGVHGRRRVGQGEAFWQFRRFETGDGPRQIDWRRSARSEQLFVREREWEAAQSAWLWRDHSPSMAYRSRADLPTKAERAGLLLLALASLLIRGGERLALLGAPQPPISGRAGLLRIADDLARRQPAANGGAPPPSSLPRHASVVLIGDFLAPPEEIEATVRALGSIGVKGHILQVLDPAEATMPFTGRTRFEGVEGEGALLVGRAESLRDAYLARLEALQGALDTMTRAIGWSFAIHRTDQAPHPPLLALYRVIAEQWDT